jgi:hypothetical protein
MPPRTADEVLDKFVRGYGMAEAVEPIRAVMRSDEPAPQLSRTSISSLARPSSLRRVAGRRRAIETHSERYRVQSHTALFLCTSRFDNPT